MMSHLKTCTYPARSLQGRIVTSVGGALVLILACFVIIALWALHQGMDEAFQGRVSLARIYAAHIDQTLDYVTTTLVTDAGSLALQPGGLTDDQRARLAALHRRIGPAASLTVATTEGMVLWNECAEPCRDTGGPSIDLGGLGELALRRLTISEKAVDAATVARVEVLLVDSSDQPSGLLISDIDPRHPSRLLLSTPAPPQGIELALISTDGRFLAGIEAAGSPGPTARLAAQAHARLIAEATGSPRAGYRVHEQMPGLFSSGHVVAYAHLETLPTWMVTVEQPIDQVLELPTRLGWYLAVFCGLTLAAVMLLAFFDVRRITAPLRQLTGAARRLSTGNFDGIIDLGGADEIGELGRTLDTMRVQLREFMKQERNVAVLGERERIAAEMHDGLGQVLGYVIMKSLAVAQLIDSGNVAEARTEVDRLGEAAREAYADVRENILALRTTLAPDRDLVSALRAYVAGFERQNDLTVEVIVGQEHVDGWIDPTAEVQLLRIVQEALTNVRKHADARRVTVRLTVASGHVYLEVADDGSGFDPGPSTDTASSHFGLQVMRERAEGIGGMFAIQSEVGGGTRIGVSLPLRQTGEADGAGTHPPG